MLRHVFYSPRMAVPDNIVKQIAEGRPVVLALLCSGLRTYYLPAAEERVEIAGEPAVTGTNIDRRHCQNVEDFMPARTATRRDQMLLSA